MGWLRFGGAVAAVVLASSVAIACGDTTSITIVEAPDGGGEASSDAPVGQPQPEAGGDSANVDPIDAAETGEASVDASACAGMTAIPSGSSTRCDVVGTSVLSCSGELRFLYSCPTDSPPLAGCFVVPGPLRQFNCPAGFVRNTDSDFGCGGGSGRAYEFPSSDGITPAVAPFAGCTAPAHVPGASVNELQACC